jgi:tetraacyldisaccharide 4'-kinase
MNADRLDAQEREALQRRLRALAPRALLCEGRHAPTGLRDLWTGEERPLSWLRGRQVAALSSLGNPENFARTLRDLGVAELEERRFPDHHLYSAREAVDALTVRPPGDAVVTTAKDAPKLRHAACSKGGDLTGESAVYVLDVDLEITAGEAELSTLVLGVAESERETIYETA